MGDKAEKEREYLLARVRDLAALCEKQGCPKFSEFLNEEQAEAVRPLAEGSGLPYHFWGGFEGASRVMLGFFPEWEEPVREAFPIVGCSFRFPAAYTLSQRDFLGSLMAQQIKRETVGDIVVKEGAAYVFVHEKVEKVLTTQIDRIGRVGVAVEKGVPAGLTVEQEYKETRGTLASLRLDAAISLGCGVSREKASELVAAGIVQKNHRAVDSGSVTVADGDVFSVRGYGKFRLETENLRTRKGRVAVRILRYQ